jgi:hypothetical protein
MIHFVVGSEESFSIETREMRGLQRNASVIAARRPASD